jgi:leader peptidase (prepilin peptidase)/N-methyltransferase
MLGFERRRVAPDEALPGVLPPTYAGVATLLVFLLLIATLTTKLWVYTPAQLLLLGALALILARTLVIDLCHFLLLDIYTIALLVLGLLSAFVLPACGMAGWYLHPLGAVTGLGIGLGAALLMAKLKGDSVTEHLGGGDIKMLAAIGAWTGPADLLMALAVTTFVGFGLAAFAQKDGRTPYGPALCLGLWLTVTHKPLLDGLFLQLARFIW